METKRKEREMVKQIEHRFHPHPLVLYDDQSQITKRCRGCMELISGPSFGCVKQISSHETQISEAEAKQYFWFCSKYHLHKKCALAPYQINHPLHNQHSTLFLRENPATDSWYVCALCKEKRNIFFYECHDCHFALDITCAFLSYKVGDNIYEFKDIDGQQHPFIFLKPLRVELKNVNCSWCHESLINVSATYFSVDFKTSFHEKCFDELLTEIDHPCHRLHTLALQFDESECFCKLCQKKDHRNLFYRCFACKFDIHRECIRLIPEVKKYHEHPFSLFYTDPFICDACGNDGNIVSYTCSTCHLQIHEKCISLPPIISFSRHDHLLFHKYFRKTKKLDQKPDCQICFREMKIEHGNYHCLEQDCNYIVHVNCATEDDDLYYPIDIQEFDGRSTEGIYSPSFSVEVNEHGEDTKIKHLNHEHCLVLKDKMKEHSDKLCDGCMLSISCSPFYCCSECNFFLHKTCAKLPKNKQHWIHRYIATLEPKDFCVCALCKRSCSGLFYESKTLQETIYLCLRCATIPYIINHQGHEHFLFFDYKCKGKCNACGVGSRYGAFRCKTCTFALDFACITLPHEIQHKCDSHLLQLAYDHDENDDEKLQYCDFCEEERDPNRWYYHCETCNTSVHPKCVLEEHIFIKNGITWPFSNHSHKHELIFVQKVDGYHECFHCGMLCQDQALKCPICFYFAHSKCEFQSSTRAKDLYISYIIAYERTMKERQIS